MVNNQPLTEQEQYELYGKLCDACNVLKKLDLKEVDRLLNQGVRAYNEKWEAEDDGDSCLYYLLLSADKLSFEDFTRTFNKLCAAGADPKRSQGLAGNLLSTAIGFGHAAIAEWLVKEKRLDVNSRDRWGRSPLYEAIISRHENREELVKLLVRYGASAACLNRHGERIYDLASPEIQRLLPRPNIKPGISQQDAWEKARQLPQQSRGSWTNFFREIKQCLLGGKSAAPATNKFSSS